MGSAGKRMQDERGERRHCPQVSREGVSGEVTWDQRPEGGRGPGSSVARVPGRGHSSTPPWGRGRQGPRVYVWGKSGAVFPGVPGVEGRPRGCSAGGRRRGLDSGSSVWHWCWRGSVT